VLTPSKEVRKRRSAAVPFDYGEEGGRGAAASLELERIHKEYEASLSSLLRQKGDAKRWLIRQQVRLQAQAIEVQWERSAIAEFLAEDRRHFQVSGTLYTMYYILYRP
jgi:hypothetical protein